MLPTLTSPPPAGAVDNTSSLLTYDSQFLVQNFLERPKHDPDFRPLFPNETTLSPGQAEEVTRLCGDDQFCRFDVLATGSLSVGNATRAAHQQHWSLVQSLQPGELWGGQGQGRADRGWPALTCRLSPRPCPCFQWSPAAGWPLLPTGARRA